MGVKAILDSVDDLPEDVRGCYTQDGDRYVLDVEDIDAHPKVRGVITANNTNKQTRDKLRAELDDLKNRFSFLPEDFDADAFQALQDAADGKGGKVTDEQIAAMRDKLAERLERKYQPEIQSREERISKLDSYLRRMVVDDGLSKAADDAGVDRDFKDAAMALIKQSAKITIEENDGQYSASVDTDMGAIPLAQYVREWTATDQGKKFVAKSTGPDPKGGRNGSDGGKTMKRATFDALAPADKTKAISDGIRVVD